MKKLKAVSYTAEVDWGKRVQDNYNAGFRTGVVSACIGFIIGNIIIYFISK